MNKPVIDGESMLNEVSGKFRLARALTLFISMTMCASTLSAQEKSMETVSQSSARPRVLLLATGGTIAGSADSRGVGAYNSGAVSAQQLIDAVPGLSSLAQLSSDQVAKVGSQDMTDDIWMKLAKRAQHELDEGNVDAVVITHGTDTMEETAFFLDLVLDINKPVVMVGSMRPSTGLGADGPANIYQAVKVAIDPEASGRGVMVVMNEQIESARGVTKMHSTNVQAMQSPNLGSIGFVDPGHVRFVQAVPTHRGAALALPADGKLPRVEVIYCHANMDARQIDHAVEDGAKGIVLAGMGDGNASKAALAALEKAAAKGVLVVRSTRVAQGYVNRNIEINDDQSGFVAAVDLNPQKARVLTQLLLVNGVSEPQKAQEAFSNVR